jgi:hypothetical protein
MRMYDPVRAYVRSRDVLTKRRMAHELDAVVYGCLRGTKLTLTDELREIW